MRLLPALVHEGGVWSEGDGPVFNDTNIMIYLVVLYKDAYLSDSILPRKRTSTGISGIMDAKEERVLYG